MIRSASMASSINALPRHARHVSSGSYLVISVLGAVERPPCHGACRSVEPPPVGPCVLARVYRQLDPIGQSPWLLEVRTFARAAAEPNMADIAPPIRARTIPVRTRAPPASAAIVTQPSVLRPVLPFGLPAPRLGPGLPLGFAPRCVPPLRLAPDGLFDGMVPPIN